MTTPRAAMVAPQLRRARLRWWFQRETEMFEGGSLEAAVMEEAAKSAVRGSGQQDSLGKIWFQSSSKSGGMPSHRLVREQLGKLKRKDQLGTEDEALVKMKRDQQNARKCFHKGMGAPAWVDYSALIEDGAADEAWRARILRGERVPPPFLEGGRVGSEHSLLVVGRAGVPGPGEGGPAARTARPRLWQA